MPQYFMDKDGVEPDDSNITFTGSHDATIDIVSNGTVEAKAVNSLTWSRSVAINTTGSAASSFVTDEYVDYSWVGRRQTIGPPNDDDGGCHTKLSSLFVDDGGDKMCSNFTTYQISFHSEIVAALMDVV
jgi:hypothetical protein